MVRFTTLASGSRGNSTVVTGGKTKILVDAGLSCRELFRRMKLAGEDPTQLNAILITHEHADHVGGVSVTARKLGIPVYFTQATHRGWASWITPRRRMSYAQWLEQRRQEAAEREPESLPNQEEDAPGEGEEELVALEASAESDAAPARPAKDPAYLPAVEYFAAGQSFQIGDIKVNPFTIPHDAADPVGFVLEAEGVRLGVATDLGYIPPNVKAQLRNLNLLYLESNHDLEMLRDGPYPWSVKQRVLSRVGHLSNDSTAEFLETEYDGRSTYLVLAHLSEKNNLPDLARVAAERALAGRGAALGDKLLLAEQHQPLPSIEF